MIKMVNSIHTRVVPLKSGLFLYLDYLTCFTDETFHKYIFNILNHFAVLIFVINLKLIFLMKVSQCEVCIYGAHQFFIILICTCTHLPEYCLATCSNNAKSSRYLRLYTLWRQHVKFRTSNLTQMQTDGFLMKPLLVLLKRKWRRYQNQRSAVWQ